jgi:hypothetical protein
MANAILFGSSRRIVLDIWLSSRRDQTSSRRTAPAADRHMQPILAKEKSFCDILDVDGPNQILSSSRQQQSC